MSDPAQRGDDHERFMRRAIELSREQMRAGAGGPFAAVIVLDGEVVGEGWNTVTSTNDPTAHAEVGAIRDACRRLGTFSLEGAVMYASCEPCPMCLAAIFWARVSKLYYANSTDDAARIGFDDREIYHQVALPGAFRDIPTERVLADDLAVEHDHRRERSARSRVHVLAAELDRAPHEGCVAGA